MDHAMRFFVLAYLRGSVLGPKNYCVYAKPAGEIDERHSINFHHYAGDTQVYMAITPGVSRPDTSAEAGFASVGNPGE